MSEYLKAARECRENGAPNSMTIDYLIKHLEALESTPAEQAKIWHWHPSQLATVWQSQQAPTPSVSTSPSQNGVWLSASAAANLEAWLRQFPLRTTTDGFRLTVQPGSVIFSTSDGTGTLTIPTGILGQPSTSGSEQAEHGDRGPAPEVAEHGTGVVATPWNHGPETRFAVRGSDADKCKGSPRTGLPKDCAGQGCINAERCLFPLAASPSVAGPDLPYHEWVRMGKPTGHWSPPQSAPAVGEHSARADGAE